MSKNNYKNPDAEIARLQREYDRLTDERDRLTKQVTASHQVTNALIELNHILQRLIELKKQHLENTPEYQRLKLRSQQLEIFREHQNMIADGFNL